MRSRVTIHDHLTHRDHVSTWCVQGYGFAPIEGAVHAAFVRAFGSSAGRIEIISLDETGGTGDLYAMGMKVTVLTVADPDTADSYIGRTYEREQAQRQTRVTRRIEYAGEKLTIAEWARRFGMGYTTLANRLDQGWTVEEALTVRVCDGGKNIFRKARAA